MSRFGMVAVTSSASPIGTIRTSASPAVTTPPTVLTPNWVTMPSAGAATTRRASR